MLIYIMRKGDRMIGGAVWRGATDPVFLENYMKMKAERERSGAGLFQELSKARRASEALAQSMSGGAPKRKREELIDRMWDFADEWVDKNRDYILQQGELRGDKPAVYPEWYKAVSNFAKDIGAGHLYDGWLKKMTERDGSLTEYGFDRMLANLGEEQFYDVRGKPNWDVGREASMVMNALGASPPTQRDFQEAFDALAEDDAMEGTGRNAMRNHRMIGGNLWDDIVDGVSMVFGSGRPPADLARPVVFERPPAQYPYLL